MPPPGDRPPSATPAAVAGFWVLASLSGVVAAVAVLLAVAVLQSVLTPFVPGEPHPDPHGYTRLFGSVALVLALLVLAGLLLPTVGLGRRLRRARRARG